MNKKKPLGMGVKELLKITLKEELNNIVRDESGEKAKKKSKQENAVQIKQVMNKQLQRDGKKESLADVENIYQQALQAYKAGKLLDALRLFGTVLWFNPQDVRSWNNLGVILFETGAVQEARNCFEKALEISPLNETARENLELFSEP